MEDKPSSPGGESTTSAAVPVTPETDRTEEKYKGSRLAAERSRARYVGKGAGSPSGLTKGRKGRSWPTLLLLGGCVATLLLTGLVGLHHNGLVKVSFLSGGSSMAPEGAKPQVQKKIAQPQTRDQEAAQPQDSAPARNRANAARPEPVPDPLKTLAVLKEKMLSGNNTAEERNSFLQGCLGLLASAVDYYARGLSTQGNQVLADLDQNLSPDFIDKADLDGDLELSGVKTRIVAPGQGDKFLVISGFVRNGSAAEREGVLLRAVLNDKDGAIIAKSFTLAGRTIPESDYAHPSDRRFQVLLDTSLDRGTLLKTTASLPFLFVFTNPPAAAKRYSVRIVLAPEKS